MLFTLILERVSMHIHDGMVMSEVTVDKFPGKSVVSMLPIIDVNPGDMSCIFSTLTLIINHNK